MNEFKVGDWVTIEGTLPDDKFQLTANEVKHGEILIAHFRFGIDKWEYWQPQVGEYVWFWKICNTELLYMFGKFYNHNEFGYIVDEDDNGSIFTSKLRYWDNCEPFIGTLPSFIKDK